MGARAMWKGVVSLDGDLRVPVRMYSALEDVKVHFRLLHGDDKEPVRQEMIDPDTEEPVPTEDRRKALEVEPGLFVMLDDDDLAELEPEASRDIGISRFVPRANIDDRWFDRPYWLGPDGHEDDYYALAQVLAEEGRVGVAHWTMRKRRYQGALMARGGHLALVRLRHAEELVPVSALETPSGREPAEQELKLAEQLVSALAGDFDLESWHDDYQEALKELIEAKAEGKLVRLPEPEERGEVAPEDLSDLLSESLKSAKGGGRG